MKRKLRKKKFIDTRNSNCRYFIYNLIGFCARSGSLFENRFNLQSFVMFISIGSKKGVVDRDYSSLCMGHHFPAVKVIYLLYILHYYTSIRCNSF